MATVVDIKDDSFAIVVICSYLRVILGLGYEIEAKAINGVPHEKITRIPIVILQPGVECPRIDEVIADLLAAISENHGHGGNQAAAPADCCSVGLRGGPEGILTPAGVALLVHRVCS